MTFLRDDEEALGATFAAKGYVIAPAEDRAALDRIRDFVAERTAAFLQLPVPDDPGTFLDTIGERLTDPARYLGATDAFITRVLARAATAG